MTNVYTTKALAALCLSLVLLMGGILTVPIYPSPSLATSEGNESESGSGDESSNDESEPEAEPEPEPEQSDPEPEVEPEPEPEPQPGNADTCQGGPPGIDGCPPASEEPEPALPICDGSAQKCITNDGNICDIGQGGHECECSEDMTDCPLHPSLLPPPVEEPTCPPGQFPVTPGDPSTCVDCEGPCPEPPPVEEGPDEDCLFHPELPKCASDNGECPPGFFQNEDANCVPDHPNGCPEGFHSHEDDETGRCIPNDVPCEPGFIIDPDFPTCSQKEAVCRDHPNIDECKDGDDDDDDDNDNVEITIVINKIIKEIHSGKHHDAFPEIDIIGLSTKSDGDSMVCLMDIDSDDIQCQDFGMPSDRVNGDFWRIIETNHNKNFDNGNTGSNDVDDAIDAIKNQDFSELDDLDNHDFGIDLVWVAINPAGEGFVCLTEDSSGSGPSLCEPFKVSSADLSDQITEGVEFS